MRRKVNIVDVLWDEGALPDHVLDRLDEMGGLEHEFEVHVDVAPRSPAIMTLMNGDPGYPAEGGEVEIKPTPEEIASDMMVVLVESIADAGLESLTPEGLKDAYEVLVANEEHWQEMYIAEGL